MSEPLPSLVVFDVNETLSDMSPLQRRFAEIGLAESDAETWFASLLRDGFALTVTGGNPAFATMVGESLRAVITGRVPPAELDGAVQHVMEGLGELGLHDDVADGVSALREQGLRLVTLSNGSADLAATLLVGAGIRPAFDALLSVADAGRWKPAREAYDHALSTCEVQDPGTALLVAVHPWDLEGAHRAGLRTAWINRSGAYYPSYFAPPDIEALSIPDLAGQLRR